jgi:hypothetical protein
MNLSLSRVENVCQFYVTWPSLLFLVQNCYSFHLDLSDPHFCVCRTSFTSSSVPSFLHVLCVSQSLQSQSVFTLHFYFNGSEFISFNPRSKRCRRVLWSRMRRFIHCNLNVVANELVTLVQMTCSLLCCSACKLTFPIVIFLRNFQDFIPGTKSVDAYHLLM